MELIFLILYLIGYILSVVMMLKTTIDDTDEITVGDLVTAILLSFFSWITFIITVLSNYSEVVLYPRKKEIEET